MFKDPPGPSQSLPDQEKMKADKNKEKTSDLFSEHAFSLSDCRGGDMDWEQDKTGGQNSWSKWRQNDGESEEDGEDASKYPKYPKYTAAGDECEDQESQNILSDQVKNEFLGKVHTSHNANTPEILGGRGLGWANSPAPDNQDLGQVKLETPRKRNTCHEADTPAILGGRGSGWDKRSDRRTEENENICQCIVSYYKGGEKEELLCKEMRELAQESRDDLSSACAFSLSDCRGGDIG